MKVSRKADRSHGVAAYLPVSSNRGGPVPTAEAHMLNGLMMVGLSGCVSTSIFFLGRLVRSSGRA